MKFLDKCLGCIIAFLYYLFVCFFFEEIEDSVTQFTYGLLAHVHRLFVGLTNCRRICIGIGVPVYLCICAILAHSPARQKACQHIVWVPQATASFVFRALLCLPAFCFGFECQPICLNGSMLQFLFRFPLRSWSVFQSSYWIRVSHGHGQLASDVQHSHSHSPRMWVPRTRSARLWHLFIVITFVVVAVANAKYQFSQEFTCVLYYVCRAYWNSNKS